MSDKRTTLDDAVAQLRSGMTIGIGGWGSRRKPMAFVRAMLRTDVKDLTVVTYGGPDLGLLCSAGKVKRVYYGFVSLDSPPFYDPWFAKARTTGAIEAREMDEGMLRCGLQAAAQRLPFLPIRAGLGSSVLNFWDGELRTVTSPYPAPGGGHETLIAMPALHLDAAFVHLNLGDARGNAAYTSIDPYFDDLFEGYRDENIYYNMPGQFIPNLYDPELIRLLKELEIVFVVGEQDVFLENNQSISNALWSKGIWNALHLWDGESHKARYWRHMVQLYL